MGRKSKKRPKNKGAAQAAGARPGARVAKPSKAAVKEPPNTTLQRVGRLATVILGAVFILAGTFKIGDAWSFLGSLPAYGIPSAARLPIAVLMPTVEVVLGFMLIAGWRMREASIAAGAFLVAFGAAIAYGWSAGTLQDCGCFGPLLRRTPPEALAQDAVLFVLAILGMVWAPVATASFSKSFSRARVGTLATITVASIAIILSTLMADPGTLEERILASEPAAGTAMPTLASLNLANRDVFLYLFHPDCHFCVEKGPLVARLAADPDLPEVIGITHTVDPGEIRYYLEHAGADFNAYELSMPSFVQITNDGATPQLVYLKRGKVERVWKGDLPGLGELKTYMSLQ